MDLALKVHLRCSVCWSFPPQGPLFPRCCNASIESPSGCICFECYYRYFCLSETRQGTPRRTWAACGCTVTVANSQHTTDALVNRLLNEVSSELTCFLCGATRVTQNELLRHYFDECPCVSVACTHCDAFGPRAFIDGAHAARHHAMVQCPVCDERVVSYEKHALQHVRDLLNTLSVAEYSEFFRAEVHRLVDASLGD